MRLSQALSILVSTKTAAEVTRGGKPFAQARAAAHKDELGFTPLAKLDGVTKEAMFEHLVELNTFSRETLNKVAEVTDEQAIQSLDRLKKLEAAKPSVGELSRGALVGATIGPLATLASRAIAGQGASGGLAHYRGVRDLAASSAVGALYGGAMPAARHHLERNVEKHKIKEYLGQQKSNPLRRKFREVVGV